MGFVRFVGLDVHKDSIVLALAEGDQAPEVLATLPHDIPRLIRRLRKLGSTGALRCCYEAGPTGFGLCRALREAGIACEVVAPALVPKRSGDRIKTDKRDAIRLARFHRSGDLTVVHVPEESTEAMRDLERARDAAKRAERVCRHQLSKLLLRHGRRYEGGRAWTKSYFEWVRKQHFGHEAQNRVLADHLKAVEDASARVERLTQDITSLVETWTQYPLVKALQAMRGIQLVTATTLVAEVGDFRRFASAPQFMAFVGLVPSEHSSGESVQRGRITRTGNAHVRRVLIEAAWAYRLRASMSRTIRLRNEGVAERVKDIAWRAQHRLHDRYVRMLGRGKNKQRTVTAIARELAGFVWSIAREDKLLAAA
jgi:transposase